uniref:Polyprotein protein n=1 Tax=Solanum tuberosum TaxID=4113 RepID=M1DVL7_SOLTU
MMEILDDPSADSPACLDVPPTSTTGDKVRVDDVTVESKVETEEEQLGNREEVVYEDLVDLDGAMYETTRQTSLRDTTMVGSSRAKDAETPSIDAQMDRATDMQTSPRLILGG